MWRTSNNFNIRLFGSSRSDALIIRVTSSGETPYKQIRDEARMLGVVSVYQGSYINFYMTKSDLVLHTVIKSKWLSVKIFITFTNIFQGVVTIKKESIPFMILCWFLTGPTAFSSVWEGRPSHSWITIYEIQQNVLISAGPHSPLHLQTGLAIQKPFYDSLLSIIAVFVTLNYIGYPKHRYWIMWKSRLIENPPYPHISNISP